METPPAVSPELASPDGRDQTDSPVLAARRLSRSALVAGLRLAWGGDDRGTLMLLAATAATFALGPVLQIIALRALTTEDYGLFAVGLGFGNIANALATAVQPVVAVRSSERASGFMLASPALTAGATALALGVAALALSPSVGFLAALFALAQLPLHALLGVAMGRLQRARGFARLALAISVWAPVRLVVVLPVILLGRASGALFVLVLPLSLAADVALMWLLRAYSGTDWSPARDRRALLTHYAGWALQAWLLNADVLYARVLLSGVASGQYAVAYTIGRLPIYAAAPIAMVLLPAALAGQAHEQRSRFWAVAGLSALLVVGSVVALDLTAPLLLRVLAGAASGSEIALVRGYAFVGALAAAGLLLFTLAFALGKPPRARLLLAIGALMFVCSLAAVRTPANLLWVHGGESVAFLAASAWTAFDASRVRA